MNGRLGSSLIFVVAFWLLPALPSARAALPTQCSALNADLQARATRLLDKLYPYDCCDQTLGKCLDQPSPSRLVTRLGGFLCKLLAEGKSDAEIEREFDRRSTSMLGSGKQAVIDHTQVAWAGDEKAPVAVVVYACARCPFCAKSVPALYRAVTQGTLKGKARLAYRIFPIKGHDHSTEGGLAMEAARQLGRFWPFVLELYAGFGTFSLAKLVDWAVAAGADGDAFKAASASDATRQAVVAAKKEGIKNQVESTPTYFISGKLYRGDLAEWALDCAILEEHDRVSGNLCRP